MHLQSVFSEEFVCTCTIYDGLFKKFSKLKRPNYATAKKNVFLQLFKDNSLYFLQINNIW